MSRHRAVQAAAVVALILVYYGIQLLTRLFAVYPYFDLPEEWTQHGNWVQMIDHHLWQLVLAVAVIFVLSLGRLRDWGLNLRNPEESLRLLKKFCVVYGVYFVGIGLLFQWLFLPVPPPEFPLTTANVVGRLFFMSVISGLSEEILFRGLMQTSLSRVVPGVWRWRAIDLPVAGLITAVIFTLVHINFTLAPFEITHLYLPQLALALVLGVYYAYAYHRTGSLLTPILAHNFSNGTLYGSSLVLQWVK